MLCLINHLDYWIAFRKVMAKIRKGAAFLKQLLDNKFVQIATSTDINKAITHKNHCLPYVCFVLLVLPLTLVVLGPLHQKWSSL